jgi:hypothetical protein
VTERTGTIVVVLSQEDASLNGVPEPFFPSIGIDLTPPSDQFWVILYVPQHFFKEKITPIITIMHLALIMLPVIP